MKIPNFINERFVDKDGYLTKPWQHTLEQLFKELQTQMSDEGHVAPSQSATNITLLDGDVTKKGALIYDETNDKLKVNVAGTIKEIQTV